MSDEIISDEIKDGNSQHAGNASGEPAKQSGQNDSVNYATHQRLLSQRKKDQQRMQELEERLNQFEEAERKVEQMEMEKKGEYEKILKEREERINSLMHQIEADKEARINTAKESAFLDSLPGKLRKQEYLSFMDKESIAIDPETGKVDEGSLKQVVDAFIQEHGVLIERKESGNSLSQKSPSEPSNLLDDKKELDPYDALIQLMKT